MPLEELIMKTTLIKTFLILFTLGFLAACSPEVGSEEWCSDMKEKDAGDWTTNEAADYTKHCIM